MSEKKNIIFLNDSSIFREKKRQAISKTDIRKDIINQRRHNRRTVLWNATLYNGDGEIKAVLFNISMRGAKLKSDFLVSVGDDFALKFKNIPLISTTVVWCYNGFFGLKFNSAVKEIGSFFDYQKY